jgi:hypothetical protein
MSQAAIDLKDAGVLSAEEQQALIASQEKLVRGYLVGIIVCAVFFWTIVGLLGGIALYVARKKQQSLFVQMHQERLPVSKTTGVLTKINGGRGLWIVSVGSYTLPMTITPDQYRKSGMNRCENQVITAEVLPTLGMNRCYYDSKGSGYNFIIRSDLA